MRRGIGALCVLWTVSGAVLSLQGPTRTPAPRLWTDDALKNWAVPVVGVNATPRFYSEAEYYAAKVDELRTYPVYVKNREPKGYRNSIRRGPFSPARGEAGADRVSQDAIDVAQPFRAAIA